MCAAICRITVKHRLDLHLSICTSLRAFLKQPLGKKDLSNPAYRVNTAPGLYDASPTNTVSIKVAVLLCTASCTKVVVSNPATLSLT